MDVRLALVITDMCHTVTHSKDKPIAMVLCQSEVMVIVLCNRKDQGDVHFRQGSYPRECKRQPAKLLTPQRR